MEWIMDSGQCRAGWVEKTGKPNTTKKPYHRHKTSGAILKYTHGPYGTINCD